MSDLSYVLHKIKSGARIRLAMGYYGEQAVLIARDWLPGSVRVPLEPSEMDAVRRALAARHRRRAARA